MELDWRSWFPWKRGQEAKEAAEPPPIRQERPRLIFAYGGNASLGSVLTKQALESAPKIQEIFMVACRAGEEFFGIPYTDPVKAIEAGEPAYMQCAFAALSLGAEQVARERFGKPDLGVGLSIGNACAYIGTHDLPLEQASERFFWRGFLMQESAKRVGVFGPPYKNISMINIENGGGHESAEQIGVHLREEFGEAIGIAIYRHGAIMVSYVGSPNRYNLTRFGTVKMFPEMAYHLPFAMTEAAKKWRVFLEPLCQRLAPNDLFLSGANGNCTKIRPVHKVRVDAICEELCTPFGWDMICEEFARTDTIVHLGIRIWKKQRDILRAITPIPEGAIWEVVTT